MEKQTQTQAQPQTEWERQGYDKYDRIWTNRRTMRVECYFCPKTWEYSSLYMDEAFNHVCEEN